MCDGIVNADGVADMVVKTNLGKLVGQHILEEGSVYCWDSPGFHVMDKLFFDHWGRWLVYPEIGLVQLFSFSRPLLLSV